jgi:hypothetical protein
MLAISIAMQIAVTVVRCGAHRSVEHIPGFTRGSHWMPPLDECSHCIAAAATMVDDFGQKHKTLTTTIFSKLTYGRQKPKVVRISYPKSDSLHTSFIQCKTPRLELKSL